MNAPGTVLLVEPDEGIARDVHLELENRGHVVLDATPDASMSSIARSTHPDVIVLDADIPAAVSPRILEEMQSDARTASVPIVLLTENGVADTWGAGYDVISKPIHPGLLVNRVETGLELHRLRQEVEAIHRDNDVGGLIDNLTGLNGGRRLRDELALHTASVKRYGGNVSIVLFDLDRFSAVNEQHGNEVGDFVMCEVGQRLLADVRTSDIAGRWRDDQFMAILPCTNVLGASFFAERFRQVLSEMPVQVNGGLTVGVTASFGCAEGVDEVEMVHAAESAIGTAKRRGRNSVVVAPVSSH